MYSKIRNNILSYVEMYYKCAQMNLEDNTDYQNILGEARNIISHTDLSNYLTILDKNKIDKEYVSALGLFIIELNRLMQTGNAQEKEAAQLLKTFYENKARSIRETLQQEPPKTLQKELPAVIKRIKKEPTSKYTLEEAQEIVSHTDLSSYLSILEKNKINKEYVRTLGLFLLGLNKLIQTGNAQEKEAAQLLKPFYESKARSIPETLREELSTGIKETKERQLKELTSKYLTMESKFVNNQAYLKQKNEGLPADKALQIAQNEWQQINTFLDSLKVNPEDSKKYQEMIVNQTLAGEDLGNAISHIRDMVAFSKQQELFKDIEISEDEWFDAEYFIENADEAVEELEDPLKSTIKTAIINFANKSEQLQELLKGALSQEELAIDPEIREEAEDLISSLVKLSSIIFSISTDVLESNTLYENIYAMLENIKFVADRLDMAQGLIKAELGESGKLTVTMPGKWKPEYGKNRKRNIEKEKEAKKRWLKRIDLSKLREDARKREEQKRQDPEYNKLQKIRTPYYRALSKTILLFLEHQAGLAEPSEKDSLKRIDLLKKNIEAFYKKAAEYKPKAEILNKVEEDLIAKTKDSISESIAKLEASKKNPMVIAILKEMLANTDSYFENAKAQYKLASINTYLEQLIKSAKFL